MWQQQRHKIIAKALPIAAIILLIVLASLQYYWVGQINVGEVERRRANLSMGAARFSEDFDRELARIYLSLQMDGVTMRDKNWKAYARQYQHWFNTAPYPRLVDKVYLVQVYEDGRLYIASYDTEVQRFRTSEWPQSLESLRERFVSAAKTIHVEGSMVVSSAPPPVVDDPPALIIPLSRMALLTDRQQFAVDADFFVGDTVISASRRPCAYCSAQFNPGPVFGYTVVLLNRAYMQQEFIPALARHYFSGPNGLEYELTITNRTDPSKVFYQSDTRQTNHDSPKPDATISLLRVRLDEFNRLLLDNALVVNNGEMSGDERRTWRIAISTVASADAGGASSNEDEGIWQLTLRHRAGSLDIAIAKLRTRDLLISFSILLLLTGSIVMLLINVRRAQRLAQQKMDFVAAISHELRTPLAVIRSAGENLADGVVLDPQRAKQYGVLIHQEGRRLTDMVEQALEFADLRSQRRSLDMRPVDIADLCERVMLDFKPMLASRDVKVKCDIDPDLPQVNADPNAMRRALQNLINNAIKYGGDDPWLFIGAQKVATNHGTEVRITVQDRGIGIAPSDLPHIFDPFYRSRSVIDSDIHGSGLGLHLVQQIIDAHGGRIKVESTLGQGTQFTIHLTGISTEEPERLPQWWKTRLLRR
jgi:signal transduction histidine kinase